MTSRDTKTFNQIQLRERANFPRASCLDERSLTYKPIVHWWTSQVLHISMNAPLTYEPIVLEHFQPDGIFFLEGFVCWRHERAQYEYEALLHNWIWLHKFTSYVIMKKCKMVSVFTYPDVNTREVGRTRDKRRKPRREAEWFPAYRVLVR